MSSSQRLGGPFELHQGRLEEAKKINSSLSALGLPIATARITRTRRIVKSRLEMVAFFSDMKTGQSYMGVSKNRGTPKSSILIGFFIINHPFWGTPIFGTETHAGSVGFLHVLFFSLFFHSQLSKCPKTQGKP